MRLIDAYKVRCDRDDYDTYADYITAFDAINEAPTIDAVPVKLTEEEINTIRIHMNAHKETLCNQHRWKEAEEYQQIVDKLDKMINAERKEE